MEIKPYYDDGKGIVIYNCDCRLVLPHLPKVDLVLTDPPYPDYHIERYGYFDGVLDPLIEISSRQLVFWSAKEPFPLSATAKHIWAKCAGCASEYEYIFEKNGQENYKLFRSPSIHNDLQARWQADVLNGHPSQKPMRLMRMLVNFASLENDLILDPFMGSGTTLVAAKQLGRRAIGIEIERAYCDIAVKRLQQEMLPFVAPEPQPEQLTL